MLGKQSYRKVTGQPVKVKIRRIRVLRRLAGHPLGLIQKSFPKPMKCWSINLLRSFYRQKLITTNVYQLNRWVDGQRVG